jgi:hypothetical protein
MGLLPLLGLVYVRPCAPLWQVRDILGDRVQVSHRLLKVAKDSDRKHWVSTFETPDGSKVRCVRLSACLSLLVMSESHLLSLCFCTSTAALSRPCGRRPWL